MKQDMLSIPKRSLIKDRIYQRAIIAALGIEGIEEQSIAIFTSVHPKTVHRWICRVEEGKPLTDIQRCGRPRRFSEAARLMTIAVYCQHTPPLPGVYRWSLRDYRLPIRISFQRWSISWNVIQIYHGICTVSMSVLASRHLSVSHQICPQGLTSLFLKTLIIGAMARPIFWRF